MLPHGTPCKSELMRCKFLFFAALACLWTSPSAAQPHSSPNKITITPNHVLAIDGKPVFTIGFTSIPRPDARTPSGKPAFEELRDAGALMLRTGPMQRIDGPRGPSWNDDWIDRERRYMDAAARAGMYCMPWLQELAELGPDQPEQEEQLRRVIRTFREHPGMGIWKGDDEPQWARQSVDPLVRVYGVIKHEDPNHPVWIVQAPRGTVDELRAYNPTYDIGGVDLYPIGYPPGRHLAEGATNCHMSMIGDYTKKMLQVVDHKKPIWLTLQISWSGVANPGKTLRFPTFPEQRFMTYQAIINGARGLVYFGGGFTSTLPDQDKPYGWNWTHWRRVLRPVIEEIGDKSPLAAALCAPDAKLPVEAAGNDVELCVREVGDDVFILACCRNPEKTAEVRFTGLPPEIGDGQVLYESPRKVTAEDGAFTDWFAPFEVHVYRFTRSKPKES